MDKVLMFHVAIERERKLQAALKHDGGDLKQAPSRSNVAKIRGSASGTVLAGHGIERLQKSVCSLQLLGIISSRSD